MEFYRYGIVMFYYDVILVFGCLQKNLIVICIFEEEKVLEMYIMDFQMNLKKIDVISFNIKKFCKEVNIIIYVKELDIKIWL